MQLVQSEPDMPFNLWHSAMTSLGHLCRDDGREALEDLLTQNPILPWKKAVFTLQTLAMCGGPQDIPLAEAWTAHPREEVARKAQRAVEALSARFPDALVTAPETALMADTGSDSMIDIAALAALEPPDPVVIPPAPPSPDPRELMEIYNPPRAVLPEGWDQPIAAPARAVTAPPPPAVTPTTASAPTGSPTAFPVLLADMTALQSELAQATSSTLGAEFIAVFNDHAAELSAIFNNDPSLGGRVTNLVDQFGGLALRLAAGTLTDADFFLSKELQHQMDALLRDLYAVASRPLASDLHKARNAEKKTLFNVLRDAGMSGDGNLGKKGVK